MLNLQQSPIHINTAMVGGKPRAKEAIVPSNLNNFNNDVLTNYVANIHLIKSIPNFIMSPPTFSNSKHSPNYICKHLESKDFLIRLID